MVKLVDFYVMFEARAYAITMNLKLKQSSG